MADLSSSSRRATASEADAPGVRHPPQILWAAGVAAFAVALILAVGFALDRHPFAADRALVVALHDAGPAWLRRAMRDITVLGGGTALIIATFAAIALLLARRLWITALLVLAATVSGSLIVGWLKDAFGRARPDIVDHLVTVSNYSFPSGHSANSATVYLTIAGLVTQVVRGRAERTTIFALAILLVGAIGISRVYLGVHWPSDVLAGWSFGTLWALAWWRVGAATRRRAAAAPP